MTRQLTTREKLEAGLERRRRKELAFQLTGMLATTVGIVFLGVFFADLLAKGSSAFVQTFVKLDVEFTEDVIAPGGELDLAYADFDGLVRDALRAEFPDVSGRSERRELYQARQHCGGLPDARHDRRRSRLAGLNGDYLGSCVVECGYVCQRQYRSDTG